MDIERFSPHSTTRNTPLVAPLPPTVEMTGFSGKRHYLEQLLAISNDTPRDREEGRWSPPLEGLY
ncbi:hypothetical protein A3K86_09075 [Photobacterium jeanii]|uniref:Uncharacterized protein n=1 Tax=Photobacterium jeanii TaxID=858640 RepID=A0A178KK24_9GAMM|nr:hypothetical protein [Photobacterium jeanii]OAN17074.1 hypothetical protein A3K86_09075 [Photobacterium jeanii]PST88363.1 hypothetical protein C9I91_17385 [Photobacterium jeanii]